MEVLRQAVVGDHTAKDETMRETILFVTLLIVSVTCFGQNWDEILHQELFEALGDPTDSIYIEDRKQLEKVNGRKCDFNTVTFDYNSKAGDKIKIQIEEGIFDPSKHKLNLADTVYKHIHGQRRVDYLEVRNIVDGRYSYGIDATIPKSDIKSLTIEWNGQKLTIPDTAFSNLYQPHLCLDFLDIESYLSKDNNNLYIYISGSDAAGSYSVKLIFDKKKYLARIVGTNEMTNGFDFLDGTAKVDD